jgi:hypothetical protein
VWRRVTLKEVDLVFPYDATGLGVQSHDALLEGLAARGRILEIETVPHDNGCGSSAVRNPPQEVAALRIPAVD